MKSQYVDPLSVIIKNKQTFIASCVHSRITGAGIKDFLLVVSLDAIRVITCSSLEEKMKCKRGAIVLSLFSAGIADTVPG